MYALPPKYRNASHLPYAMDVPNCRHEPLDIKAMLQEQQATLTKILETQGQFQKKQDSLELKLKEVEELISVTKEVTPSSSSTDSSSKRKRIVSLALSVSLCFSQYSFSYQHVIPTLGKCIKNPLCQ